MNNGQLDQRSKVPKDYRFHFNEWKIIKNGNQTMIKLPSRDWDEAVARQEQKVKSTDTAVDLEAAMKKMKGQMVIKIVNTAAEQALTTQPDPRDAIPLNYCDKTRRIIALVGFIVSTATIFRVQMAAVADRVPGFQPLPISSLNSLKTEALSLEFNLIALGLGVFTIISMVTLLAGLYSHSRSLGSS